MIKKIVKIISLITVVMLVGCSPTIFTDGRYKAKKSPHGFIFSSDSTFRYIYSGFWHKESSGIWSQQGDTVYLNTYDQIDKFPVMYVKTKGTVGITKVNIIVDIIDKPDSNYTCYPVVNGKKMDDILANNGSYSIVLDVPIDSLSFIVEKNRFPLRGLGYYMGYDDVITETIYPRSSVGEDIDVSVKIIDSLFGYKVLSNEKLKIKGKNLIFKENNKDWKLHFIKRSKRKEGLFYNVPYGMKSKIDVLWELEYSSLCDSYFYYL